MSKEKRRVPKLRFPGFTEDWEQRKLESLFTKYEDKVKTPNSGYWRLGLRSHCKGTFHTYVDAGNELETAEMNRVQSGNFILNITFAWERALAVTNEEDQDKLVSHRFPQFKPNRDLAIDFFKHTLMDKRFKHHLELSSPGGAGRNKVLKIADMLKYELLVPSMKEQNEISSFLNNVDYIITLHQRKLEHLNLKKKALLQKLFPKNGERYPELRFPGFTDAWEQRKFDEIMTFINGRAYKQDELLSDGKYKVLRVGNFYTNDSWYYSNLELDDKYYAMNGDLLYTWSATFGPHIWKGEKVIYHYHIWKIVLKNKIDKLFALQLLEVDKANIMSDKNGSTMVHITKQGMENKKTILPLSLNEQKQISKFLSSIDKLITLHQRKLEHLQLQKKALLQQMFV